MPDSIEPDPEIEAEIKQIQTPGIEALRKRWCAMFGVPPPKALGKHITARMIAYRIQEEAFGGLDRDTIKSLERLAQSEPSTARPVSRKPRHHDDQDPPVGS